MIIYCIKNKTNNKEYIGLTTRSLDVRWKQHVRESNGEKYWEYNTPLGNAIKKYGKDSFEVFAIKKCTDIESMKQDEINTIKERKSHVSLGGYNLTLGGDGRFGAKLSQETKNKISVGNKLKGKRHSQQFKSHLSELKKQKYKLGGHPKALSILINKKEKFNCIKEFTNKYNLKYSTVVSSLKKNNGKTIFKGFEIERTYDVKQLQK